MFWIVLAAQAASTTFNAEHGDLRTLFAVDDYPATAARKGEQGEVVAALLVNPEGGVETCGMALSSGYKQLDDTTCAIFYQRARFSPAKDGDGHAMYSLIRTPPITWSLGHFRGFPVPPDYDLTINRAPEGVKLPVEFTVSYVVTRDGKARDCMMTPGKAAPADFVALACHTIATAPAEIIRNREGLPVEAGKDASFRFSLDKSRPK